jgi:hypothetical protein
MRKANAMIVIAISIVFSIMPTVSALPKHSSLFQENVSLVAGSASQGIQISQGNVLYVTNAISSGTVAAVSGLDLSGEVWTKLTGFYDATTGTGIFYGKWRITTSLGSFSGNIVGQIATIDCYTYQIQGNYVGFGDGNYKGDRIKGFIKGNAAAETLAVAIEMFGTFYDKTYGYLSTL